MKKILMISLTLIAAQSHAGIFDSINKVLNTTDAVLDFAKEHAPDETTTPQAPVAQNTTPMSYQAQMTQQQSDTIYSLLANVDATGNSALAIKEATPNLHGFLAKVACSDVYGMKNIGLYTTLDAAKNIYKFSGAMRGMQYHPKNQCVTVTQIGNTAMPALNALELQVMFVSEASGESSTRKYLLMKQANGNWLIDKASNGINPLM